MKTALALLALVAIALVSGCVSDQGNAIAQENSFTDLDNYSEDFAAFDSELAEMETLLADSESTVEITEVDESAFE